MPCGKTYRKMSGWSQGPPSKTSVIAALPASWAYRQTLFSNKSHKCPSPGFDHEKIG